MRSAAYLFLIALLSTQTALAGPQEAQFEILNSHKWGRLYFFKDKAQPDPKKAKGTIINLSTCSLFDGEFQDPSRREFKGTETLRSRQTYREGAWDKDLVFTEGVTNPIPGKELQIVRPNNLLDVTISSLVSYESSTNLDKDDSQGLRDEDPTVKTRRYMPLLALWGNTFGMETEGDNMTKMASSSLYGSLLLLFPILPESTQNRIGGSKLLLELPSLHLGSESALNLKSIGGKVIKRAEGTVNRNGECHGACIVITEEGKTYKGNFINGSLNGKAEIKDEDGHILNGNYSYDLPVGLWKHEWPNGTKDFQMYRNGTALPRLHGTLADDTVTEQTGYHDTEKLAYYSGICSLTLKGNKWLYDAYGDKDKENNLIQTIERTFTASPGDAEKFKWTDKTTEDEIFGTSERDKIALPWRVRWGLYAALLVMLVLSGSFIVFSIRLFILPLRIMYRAIKTLTPAKKKS